MTWRVVDTDNFGGDYPDEKFVGPTFISKHEAEKWAYDNHNSKCNEYCSRYYKVVEMPYKLVPGFSP